MRRRGWGDVMARGGGSAERCWGWRLWCVRARPGPGGGSGGRGERGRAGLRYRPPLSPPLHGAGPLSAPGSRGAGGRRTGDPAVLRPWSAGERGPGAGGRVVRRQVRGGETRLSAPSLLWSLRVRSPALRLHTHAWSVVTGVLFRFHILDCSNKEPLKNRAGGTLSKGA